MISLDRSQRNDGNNLIDIAEVGVFVISSHSMSIKIRKSL